MKSFQYVLVMWCVMVALACSSKVDDKVRNEPSPTDRGKTRDTPNKPATPDKSKPADTQQLSDTEIPTVEDFEAEAAKAITDENLAEELAVLEKELED